MEQRKLLEDEVAQLLAKAEAADCVVTTEKDSVRIPTVEKTLLPVYFLRVEIEILSGEDAFEDCIAHICQPTAVVPPMKLL